MTTFIIDTVRTPRGKAKPTGGLASVSPIQLVVQLLGALQERTGFDPDTVDEVILGCSTQAKEQGTNIAKTAALLAGLPPSVSGMTINRFCASGLDAVNLAHAKVAAGLADVVIAGGVESVSRVPMLADGGPLYTDPNVAGPARSIHMGVAADLVATLEGFERPELDAYGVRSHHRAAEAWRDGRFAPSLVTVTDADGNVTLETDEHVRPTTSVEALADIPPSFAGMGAAGMDAVALAAYPEAGAIQHLHHRGNSPALADGAALVLVCSAEAARAFTPRAAIRSAAATSVCPVMMLTSGQAAVVQALDRARLSTNDIGLFEYAEAFAALCLKFQRDLDVGDERFNVNGGTIAMGHAFGATGAILVATLLDEMVRRRERYGVVSISGGAGLGAASVIERVDA